MDREAWSAVVHGVAKNWTRQSDLTELNWTFWFSYLKNFISLWRGLVKPGYFPNFHGSTFFHLSSQSTQNMRCVTSSISVSFYLNLNTFVVLCMPSYFQIFLNLYRYCLSRKCSLIYMLYFTLTVLSAFISIHSGFWFISFFFFPKLFAWLNFNVAHRVNFCPLRKSVCWMFLRFCISVTTRALFGHLLSLQVCFVLFCLIHNSRTVISYPGT